MSTAPYGEARRLRYFIIICEQSLRSPSVDMDLFLDKVLKLTKIINPKLSVYIRNTGIMQTRAVARNYLRFAAWLNFLRLENRLVVPNSYTVFFANLGERNDFFLSEKEKIGFFLNLVKLEAFIHLLSSLKIKNSVKDFVKPDLSEHFVESFFEWFIDLGIVTPTSPKFGAFVLTSLGYSIRKCFRNQHFIDGSQQWKVVNKYISNLLNTKLKDDIDISDRAFWSLFQKSLEKLDKDTQSEIDPKLYSALPLILDLQIRLIYKYHILVPINQIIQKLKDISPYYDTVFNWDPLAKEGYIKIQR